MEESQPAYGMTEITFGDLQIRVGYAQNQVREVRENQVILKDGSSFTSDGKRFDAQNDDGSRNYGVFCSEIIKPSDSSFYDLQNRFSVKCVGMNPDAYLSKIENGIRLIFSRMNSEYADDPISHIKRLKGLGSIDDYVRINEDAVIRAPKKYTVENMSHALLRVFGYDSAFDPSIEEGFFDMDVCRQISEAIEEMNTKAQLTPEEEGTYNEYMGMLGEFRPVMECLEIEGKVFKKLVSLGIVENNKEGRNIFDYSIKKYKSLLKIGKAYVSSNGAEGKEKGNIIRDANNNVVLISQVIYNELKRRYQGASEEEIENHLYNTLEEYGFQRIDLMKVKTKFSTENNVARTQVKDEIYNGTLKSMIEDMGNDFKLMYDYLHWNTTMIFADPSLHLDRLSQITRKEVKDSDGKPVKDDEGNHVFIYILDGKPVNFDEAGHFYTGKEDVVKALFSIREGKYANTKPDEFLNRFFNEAGLDPMSHRVYAVQLDDMTMNILASETAIAYSSDSGGDSIDSRLENFKKIRQRSVLGATKTIEERLRVGAMFEKSGRFGEEALNYLLALAEDGIVDPFEEIGIKEFYDIIKRYPDRMDSELAKFIVQSFREYVRPEKVYSDNIRAAIKVFSQIVTYGLDDMPYLLPQFLHLYMKGRQTNFDVDGTRRLEHEFIDKKVVQGELNRWENPLKEYESAKEKMWAIDTAFASVTTDVSTPDYIHSPEFIPAEVLKDLISKGLISESYLKEQGIDVNKPRYKDAAGQDVVEFEPKMKEHLEAKRKEEESNINPFYETIFDYRRVSMGSCVRSCSQLISSLKDLERIMSLETMPFKGVMDMHQFREFFAAKKRLDDIDPTLYKMYVEGRVRKRFEELHSENPAENYGSCLTALDSINEVMNGFDQEKLKNRIDEITDMMDDAVKGSDSLSRSRTEGTIPLKFKGISEELFSSWHVQSRLIYEDIFRILGQKPDTAKLLPKPRSDDEKVEIDPEVDDMVERMFDF